jgi:hypothetical protein
MATREQIDRAARADRRPVGQMIDDRSTPYLYGATTPVEQAELDRATRLAARMAPDITEPLGLAPPPVPATAAEIIGHDVLEMLQRMLWDEGEAAARQWLAGIDPDTLRLAKAELARRRPGAR